MRGVIGSKLDLMSVKIFKAAACGRMEQNSLPSRQPISTFTGFGTIQARQKVTSWNRVYNFERMMKMLEYIGQARQGTLVLPASLPNVPNPNPHSIVQPDPPPNKTIIFLEGKKK